MGSKGRKTKGGKPEQSEQSNEDMPSVAEVCENFGLTDVDLEYSEADYQNLTTYKLFQQTYRQRIQGANPKVPQPKLMMLVAAKWREFQSNGESLVADDDLQEEDETPSRRNGRSSGRVRKQKVVEDYDFDEEEEEENRRKSKSKGKSGRESSSKSAKKSSKSSNSGSSKKEKVPTLKIKLGGRSGRGRRGESSEEDKEDKDSDAEFEEMLKEAEEAEEVPVP